MSNVIMLRNLSKDEMKAIDDLKSHFHTNAGSKTVMSAVMNFKKTYDVSKEREFALNQIHRISSQIVDENTTKEEAMSLVVAIRKLARDQKIVLAKPSSGRSSRANKM